MPYKRVPRRSKRSRRRPTRRRRGTAPKKTHVGRTYLAMSRPPLGKFYKCMLPYCEQNVILNPTFGGAVTSYVFSANGLYDPNISGGGHQPYGFDQIMNMYNHYVVIASKITVTFCNDDSTNRQYVGIRLKDTGTPEIYPTQIMEAGMTKYALLGPKGDPTSMLTLSVGCSPKKFFHKELSADSFKGNVGANPADQVFFHLWASAIDTTDTGVINCQIRIQYIALFTEPKTFEQS